jgi:hypothetical protein
MTVSRTKAATNVSLGAKTMSGLKRLTSLSSVLLTMLLLGLYGAPLRAQTLDENALKGMKW